MARIAVSFYSLMCIMKAVQQAAGLLFPSICNSSRLLAVLGLISPTSPKTIISVFPTLFVDIYDLHHQGDDEGSTHVRNPVTSVYSNENTGSCRLRLLIDTLIHAVC